MHRKYIKVRGMNTKNERVLWYIQCPSEDDFHHVRLLLPLLINRFFKLYNMQNDLFFMKIQSVVRYISSIQRLSTSCVQTHFHYGIAVIMYVMILYANNQCRRCGRCICCTCSNHFVVLDDMGYTTKERYCFLYVFIILVFAEIVCNTLMHSKCFFLPSQSRSVTLLYSIHNCSIFYASLGILLF